MLKACTDITSSFAVKARILRVDGNKMMMRMWELPRDEVRGNQNNAPLMSFIIFILRQIRV
jgi:hypothetical protein